MNSDMTAAVSTDLKLRITEIFFSLQGESTRVGLPTVFVRLTGCPLRCRYCDTAYAFHGGENRSIDEVIEAVGRHRCRYVTVTGGEPLAQRHSLTLLKQLCDAGYLVSLETSGAVDVSKVDPRVMKVLDLKTPASGEAAKNRYENLACLNAGDQIKFVICDRGDYDWTRQQIDTHRLADRCEVLLSPAGGRLPPAALADWILADNLPVRMQVQLHKVLWGDVAGR